ncbi:mRNA surveillance protein pelota [Candidatus Woesearchaeota archaeon]|jgi:protein pelota|nr:mRNA surveillance protein pelota [Candidatus Woesearchaeota archaeon]
MIIINSDFKTGIVKLKITEPEDLWYLSHLIDPGDFIKGKTTRKIKIGQGENAKVAKKNYYVKIEAETIDFGSSGETLRINGKIKEAPEEIPKDSYQAIALELGTEFIIEKVSWLEYQKQKLQEATEKRYNYLICIFDREEAIFALTKKFGYEIILKMIGEVAKKAQEVEIKKNFQLEIIKSLEEYNQRYSPEHIIVASPAFWKEDLFKKVSNPELKKKIVLASCSDISERSIDEVIKRPELDKIMGSSRTRKEKLLMDELLNEINKNNLAVYGFEEVKKAITAGAISKLLITDDFIQQKREEGYYLELDELMKKIDHLQGEINIISSQQESGQKLDGLGGVAALLRYKLKW